MTLTQSKLRGASELWKNEREAHALWASAREVFEAAGHQLHRNFSHEHFAHSAAGSCSRTTGEAARSSGWSTVPPVLSRHPSSLTVR
jgi:hypothetical protein